MISNATNALNTGADASKATPSPAAPNVTQSPASLSPSKDGAASTPDWTYDSAVSTHSTRTESLYLKYTSRDGDVLELQAESSEDSYTSETARFSATSRALSAGRQADGSDAGSGLLGADGKTADAAEDPKAKQLADLRAWAQQVEKELRQQQHKILEQILKQSGRPVDSGDGKFLMLYVDGSGQVRKSDGSGKADGAGEAQVPEYWNAENTSDRIVHFATQMAEISGLDPQTILDAVGKGFDQAQDATGDLPGAAGKLNKDTKDLVFSKLTKWLEDRKSEAYNQGAQSQALTSDVPYGTANNQQ